MKICRTHIDFAWNWCGDFCVIEVERAFMMLHCVQNSLCLIPKSSSRNRYLGKFTDNGCQVRKISGQWKAWFVTRKKSSNPIKIYSGSIAAFLGLKQLLNVHRPKEFGRGLLHGTQWKVFLRVEFCRVNLSSTFVMFNSLLMGSGSSSTSANVRFGMTLSCSTFQLSRRRLARFPSSSAPFEAKFEMPVNSGPSCKWIWHSKHKHLGSFWMNVFLCKFWWFAHWSNFLE